MTTIDHAILLRSAAYPARGGDVSLRAFPGVGRNALPVVAGSAPLAPSRRMRAASCRQCSETRRMRQCSSSPMVSTRRRLRARLAPVVGGLCLIHGLTACQLTSDKADLAVYIPDNYRYPHGRPDAALPKLD